MSSDKLLNNATPSTKGTIYQLCVAVEKCYEMVLGQKVLIECQGDVTIPDSQQVETKFYSDALTDNHPNIWKTLLNWMQDGFDPTTYSSLILYTTQQFGERSTISEWNGLILQQRIEALEGINRLAEERELERHKKAPGGQSKIPDVLSHQRFVLDALRRSKLHQVLERFAIEACSPNLSELHTIIKQRNIKGILEGKKDDFLNALIGFITKADEARGKNWEITYEEFDEKVGDLNTLYCRETRVFPKKYLDCSQPQNAQQLKDQHNYTFVRKIRDIEYHEVVPKAVSDYIAALRTLHEEFKNYEVPPQRTKNYAEELIELFTIRYRKACRGCIDIIKESKDFLDDTTAEEPRSFEGFDDRPPLSFRNGLLHSQLDDEDKNLKWRLEKHE
jgi:hypothetical protein